MLISCIELRLNADYFSLFRNGYIYWSDANNDQLYRSNFDGGSSMFLANATHEDIGKDDETCVRSNIKRP